MLVKHVSCSKRSHLPEKDQDHTCTLLCRKHHRLWDAVIMNWYHAAPTATAQDRRECLS